MKGKFFLKWGMFKLKISTHTVLLKMTLKISRLVEPLVFVLGLSVRLSKIVKLAFNLYKVILSTEFIFSMHNDEKKFKC